ncbi:MAG: polysaccharide biosynthesis tyrosine autokinase [Candidatus Riflebacteria bacterium]|nr:polysaccharide biosynthesis tyrosine autokinase [Candidatus Riflebacteria bacterium]
MSRSGSHDPYDGDAPRGDEQEFHLGDYLHAFFKFKWVILGAAALGGLYGGYQNATSIAIFQASAKVLVSDPVQTAQPQGPTATMDFIQKKIQVLKSIPVAEEVYRRFCLKEPEKEAVDPKSQARGRRLKEIIDPVLEGQIKDPAYLRNVLGIRDRLSATPVGSTQVIQLSAAGPSPTEVADLVNTYAKVFETKSLELKNYEARKANVLLTANLEAAQEELIKAEEKLKKYKKDHDVPALEERIAYLTRKKTFEFEEDLAKLETEAKTMKVTGGFSAQDSARDRALSSQAAVRAAQARLADLRKRFTEEHPDVVAAEQALGRAQAAASHSSGGGASVEQSRAYKLLQLKRDELLKKKEVYGQELSRLLDNQSQHAILTREMSAAESIYRMLLTKQKEATIKEAMEVSDARLIEPAFVPSVPILPDKRKNLTTALSVGLMLGIGLALLLQQMDQSLRSKDEIAKAVNLPVLGVVLASEDLADRGSLSKVVALDNKSPTTEAIRSLRTAIKYGYTKDPDKTLLVTSASPSEGKTTIATNLAISLAQIGERVLLVDVDLRKPRLHKVFAVDNGLGVTNGILRPLSEVVQTTEIPNLWLIPSGPLIPNASELLFSDEFKKFVATVRQSFDRVIFDTPPVNAVTDAAVLGSAVDGILFVVSAGRNTRGTLKVAMEALQSARDRLRGVVVNGLERRALSYQHYYYYRYYGERQAKGQ